MNPLIYTIIAAAGGVALGYVGRHYLALSRKNSIESELDEKILEAKRSAKKIEEDALKFSEEIKTRLDKHEERLERREDELESKEEAIKLEKEKLLSSAEQLKIVKENIINKEKSIDGKLEKIANLTTEEAKNILINKIEKENTEDFTSRHIKLMRDGEKKLEIEAQKILTSVMMRVSGSSNITEAMTSVVDLPDEETKGKIIGKEGRNIKAFERASGVEVLIDEMPNAVVISCFDPVRRAIAKNAMEMLIKDGRIQPAKIEEFLLTAKKDIGVFMRRKGEEAIEAAGILSLPDEIIPILGRLYFRTSYGQNVLDHSIEMAHIAGMIAKEIGADVSVAKAGALLHDLGKAVDMEIEGTHVEIARKIFIKYGVDEKIMKAMQAHHEEYPYETIESILVKVADDISGGRPGARRDTVENYIKRLTDLEGLVKSFDGIEKVYALQAGREVRVFVEPNKINDLESLNLARNIAKKIETDLKYPGEIKVNVIRESRAIEFAR
jgi:ribonuclease Y